MIEAADTKLRMAQKEYYPDFSINAGYFNRSGDFKDMWSATATINIPSVLQNKTGTGSAGGEGISYTGETGTGGRKADDCSGHTG